MELAITGLILLFYLIVVVLFPLLKRKRCTHPVVARISNQHYFYTGKAGRIKGRMTYTYKNQAVVRDIFIKSKKTMNKEILINPNKPEEWVDKSWNSYYGTLVLCGVIALLFIGRCWI